MHDKEPRAWPAAASVIVKTSSLDWEKLDCFMVKVQQTEM